MYNLFLEDAVSTGIDLNMVKWICTGVFIGIIVIIVLSALIGMKKGLGKNVYRLVWNAIMIVLGAVLTSTIAKSIEPLDISSIGSFAIGESTVTCTTVLETIENLVVAVGGSDETSIAYIAVHDADTMALVAGLSHTLICYIVFILWMLLTVTIFKLIGQLFWSLLFSRFFDRKNREYKKNLKAFKKCKDGSVEKPAKPRKYKLAGLGLGLVNAAMLWFMCMTPLTSMVNTVGVAAKNYANENESDTHSATYTQLMSYVEAYNSSAFGTVGGLTADKDGVTFDAKIMDFITATEVDGQTIHMNSELNEILTVGITLVDAGVFEGGFSFSSLTSDLVSKVLNNLKDSNLFTSIMKIAAGVAVNYGDVKGLLDAEKVDLSSVKWDEEIENIDKIYQAVYDTGILDNLSSIKIPVGAEGEEDKVTAMKEVFDRIDDSNAIGQIVSSVLYTLANKTTVNEETGVEEVTGLGKYLSSDWSTYDGLEIGHEVKLIYEFACNLYEKADININDFLSTSSENPETPEDSGAESRINPITKCMKNRHYSDEYSALFTTEYREGEESEDEESSSILDKLLDKVDDVIPLITGIGTEEHPACDSCLLDSTLITDSFTKIGSLVTNMITSSEYGSDINADKVTEILDSLDTKEKIATEVDAMLRAAKYLVKDAGVLNGGLDLESDETKAAIKSSAVYIDQSKLFTYMMPVMLKKMISSVSFGDFLDPSTLNFDNIKFGDELPVLVDLYSDINSFTDINNIDIDKLTNALEKLCSSRIFNVINGGATYDEDGNRTNLSAFEQLIKYVLHVSTFDSFLCATGASDDEVAAATKSNILSIANNLADSELTSNDWLDTYDDEGHVVSQGEISKFVEVVKNYKDLGISGFDSSSIGGLEMSKLNSLLKSFNNAKLLNGAMGRVFETTFDSIGISSYCDVTPDYYLSSSLTKQADYDDEIDILTSMIGSLQVEDSEGNKSLFNFATGDRSAFTSFIDNGGSLSAIICGLDYSKILGSNAGSIFTSLFENVGLSSSIYPYSGTHAEKVAEINSLFALDSDTFQTTVDDSGKSVEGTALDNLITTTSSIEGLDLSTCTSTTVAPLINIIKSCVASDGTDRAYLASEIFAGEMQEVFKSVSQTLSDNHDWHANSFELVSHRSADGLTDAFAAKDAYQAYYDAPSDDYDSQEEAFRNAMVELDTYNTSSAADSMINDLINEIFLNSSTYTINGVAVSTIISDCTTYEAKADKIITAMRAYKLLS